VRPKPSAEHKFGQDGGLADADVLRRGEQGEHRLPVRELAQVPVTLEHCRNDKVRPHPPLHARQMPSRVQFAKARRPTGEEAEYGAKYGGLPVRNIAKSTGMQRLSCPRYVCRYVRKATRNSLGCTTTRSSAWRRCPA
jgi:hypothetical protein